MSNTSSKEQMEEVFDKLENIARVKAPEDLWDNITSRIEIEKPISFGWISAAAACLTILIMSEAFIASHYSEAEEQQTISEMIDLPNNDFYNE